MTVSLDTAVRLGVWYGMPQKKMCYVQSVGPGPKREIVEVYVYGGPTRKDEGDHRLDMRIRPTRLGPGPYTSVVARDMLEACPPRARKR